VQADEDAIHLAPDMSDCLLGLLCGFGHTRVKAPRCGALTRAEMQPRRRRCKDAGVESGYSDFFFLQSYEQKKFLT